MSEILKLECSSCGAKLRAKIHSGGKTAPCPKCGKPITVPQADSPQLPSPVPPPKLVPEPLPIRPAPQQLSATFDELEHKPAANVAATQLPASRKYLFIGIVAAVMLAFATFAGIKLLSVPILSSEQVVAASEKSVAQIKGLFTSGTGFLVRSGVVVTNRHVISEEYVPTLEVTFPSALGADRGPFRATLLYDDPSIDLAFLSVKTDIAALPIAEDFEFHKGQDVIVIGSPGVNNDVAIENAISKGVISTETTIDGETFRQLGISINPGNSGGPVLDSLGHVIGVVTLKALKQEGLAFCIPLNQLQESLARATTLSDTDRQLMASKHQARTMLRVLATLGAVLKERMRAYADGMKIAIDHGRSATEGLQDVKSGRSDDITRQFADLDSKLFVMMQHQIEVVTSDTTLPDSVRSKFADLWANYSLLRTYVNDPHGTYSSYNAKFNELSDTREQLIESLELLVGK
jgi:S1-C subfamily serine protease